VLAIGEPNISGIAPDVPAEQNAEQPAAGDVPGSIALETEPPRALALVGGENTVKHLGHLRLGVERGTPDMEFVDRQRSGQRPRNRLH
jgi:hypothetical protein